MNAKRKIISSLMTMFSMVLIVVCALAFAISMPDIQEKKNADAFNAYGVAASVSGNYYVGKTSNKMFSGDNDSIVFESFDQESSPALDPAGEIKLTSTNDYVVFEYKFTNNSDNVSFVANLTNLAEAKNMDISYGFSYKQLKNFDSLKRSSINAVPVISGKGNTLYLYIKAKIANSNAASSLKGSFCFSLTSEEVYKITLIDGSLWNGTYAALGYELNDIEVPEKAGYKFEGYFTLPGGLGEQVFDKNGQTDKIWIEDKGATLFAHYSKISEK